MATPTIEEMDSVLDTRDLLLWLTPTQRRVTQMLMDGHTYASCGQCLGITPQAVHQCVCRVRRTLISERPHGLGE